MRSVRLDSPLEATASISLPEQICPRVLLISNDPTMATALKKGEHMEAEPPLCSQVSCYRRRENLSVRCPLVLLIRKVTECLALHRWHIIGKPFRNDLC